jgi:hypothetical protein
MRLINFDFIRQSDTSDVLLSIIFIAGIFYAPALPLVFLTLLWRGGAIYKGMFINAHLFFALSAFWGGFIVFQRGVGDSASLLLQYAYIWALPFFFVLYRPTRSTYVWVMSVVVFLFSVDFVFNIYSVVFGTDILGRVVDQRISIFGVRAGGIFGHAFYSGSISLLACLYFYSIERRSLFLLAIVNLLFAGSWRFLFLVPVIFLFGYFWVNRSRAKELIAVVLFSLLSIFMVVFTATDNPLSGAANGSNALRVFAWLNSIVEISQSPVYGVGYPVLSGIDGISDAVIEENLIAESWYLNAAITFGLPYLFFRFFGVILVFYGRRFSSRTRLESLLAPIVLIDLAYGGFFEAALPYFALCLLWSLRHEAMSTAEV